MNNIFDWILAILIFGLLIFLHEMGHFLFARLFGVRVEEFSIGMGPKVWSHTAKKSGTRYSLGILPFGGYVSMLGEEEGSDDPDSFTKKAAWKRLIITVAGAAMNLLTGLVLMFILVAASGPLGSNTVHSYPPDSYFEENDLISSSATLLPGDEILAINGKATHISFDLSYEIMHKGGEGPVHVTVLRDGVERTLSVTFPSFEENGVRYGMMDFYVCAEEKTVPALFYHTWHRTTGVMTMIWDSFGDLFSGRYGMEAVSGPIGVADAMTEAVQTGGFLQLLLLVAVITINLGIVNLLPIPALDGGRIAFLLIEIIFRRPVPQKLEALVNFIGIVLLFTLMILIMFKDIIALFP